MENILITGANGFIGSHLVEFLVQKEFNIYALDFPNCQFKNLERFIQKQNVDDDIEDIHFGKEIAMKSNVQNLIFLKCDLNDSNRLETIIEKVQPRYIFHLGALSLVKPSWNNPRATIRVNVIGTINVFEAVKKKSNHSRVVLACTSTEYGTAAKSGRALNEEDQLLAIHPYGISKLAAELLARQYFLNFNIESIRLRFFNQTGPRKTVGAATEFTRQVAAIDLGLQEPLIEVGNLDACRDFMGIRDTIQAIWLGATKGKPGEVYVVCSGEKTKIEKLLDISLSFSENKINIKRNVISKTRKSDEDTIIGDNSKIRKELGFRKTQSIEEVLKDLYDFWHDYYKNK